MSSSIAVKKVTSIIAERLAFSYQPFDLERFIIERHPLLQLPPFSSISYRQEGGNLYGSLNDNFGLYLGRSGPC